MSEYRRKSVWGCVICQVKDGYLRCNLKPMSGMQQISYASSVVNTFRLSDFEAVVGDTYSISRMIR